MVTGHEEPFINVWMGLVMTVGITRGTIYTKRVGVDGSPSLTQYHRHWFVTRNKEWGGLNVLDIGRVTRRLSKTSETPI